MKFILILIYFLREEIKLNFRRLKIIYVFIREFSIFRYFTYLFNNSFIPCRDKVFRSYLHKNSQKWKNKNNSRNINLTFVIIKPFYISLLSFFSILYFYYMTYFFVRICDLMPIFFQYKHRFMLI